MNLRLIDFVRTAARYAAEPSDSTAARLIDLPHSGVPRADGRALAVASGERGIRSALEHEILPLPHASLLATRRFSRALAGLAAAYPAPDLSARAFVRDIASAFELDAALDEDERATLTGLENIAAELDRARTPTDRWNADDLLRALDRAARATSVPARETIASPLPMRTPEPPYPVTRRRMHFSASSLGMFAECERRWFYRYVCNAVEDKGSAAALYGTTLHWALEQFHQEYPRADATADEAALERRLDEHVLQAFDKFRGQFATVVEFELQRRRARATARRYLAWFLERSRARPFGVIGTEAEVALELEGYRFIGYIDRLDREDATGNVTVIDYKTGSIAVSAAEQRAKIAAFMDFQLPFYYWVRTAMGDRVTRLSLVPLKEASLDVRPVELEVVPVAAPYASKDAPIGTIGIDELERARAKMIELARALSDDPLEYFRVTEDPEACAWCAYQNACRNRPSRTAPRFAK